jgi:multiple sugar transport system ATP-binding protein
MAGLTLESLTKVYPTGQIGVDSLNLQIEDGELLVLVGPSGCGKSTALRMIAGLETISSGTLRIGDRPVNDLPPKERDIAMVFQNYALYPHMSVRQNIGFALKLAGLPREEIDKRVNQAAASLQLEQWMERKPGQLSGGQRQRVAMGRAIVRNPAVFLMDEPLSNLDAKLRVQMRVEIARLQRELKVTTIYVTHDQVEAMTMGDRVAVLREGKLQQVASPQELYNEPVNVFVAAFIGSPSMNLLDAGVEKSGSDIVLTIGDQKLTMPANVVSRHPHLEQFAGKRIIVGMRPEIFWDPLAPGAEAASQTLRANVEIVESLGSEILLHVRMNGQLADTADTRQAQADDLADAEIVAARRNEGDEVMLVTRVDPRSKVAAGEPVQLGIDVDRLHFFDPASGEAISRWKDR